MRVQNQVLHRLVDFLNAVPGHQFIKFLPGAEPDSVAQFLFVVLDSLLGGLRRTLLAMANATGRQCQPGLSFSLLGAERLTLLP
ncbi:hypothetical protein HNR03_000140 [Pseudomonas sp. JAI111]|nr:hypothetical protein [Pseudomonas sp. JAI111]MCS3835560.1 hypothetical protein [Pseudomonas sp. JAI111]